MHRSEFISAFIRVCMHAHSHRQRGMPRVMPANLFAHVCMHRHIRTHARVQTVCMHTYREIYMRAHLQAYVWSKKNLAQKPGQQNSKFSTQRCVSEYSQPQFPYVWLQVGKWSVIFKPSIFIQVLKEFYKGDSLTKWLFSKMEKIKAIYTKKMLYVII